MRSLHESRSVVIECKGFEIQPIRAKELECLMTNHSEGARTAE